MPELPVQIPSEGRSLAGVAHLPEILPAPVVVCCHGLHSSKESEKFIAVSRELAENGFAALRFDFGGCGESPASDDPDLVGARLRDLLGVME